MRQAKSWVLLFPIALIGNLMSLCSPFHFICGAKWPEATHIWQWFSSTQLHYSHTEITVPNSDTCVVSPRSHLTCGEKRWESISWPHTCKGRYFCHWSPWRLWHCCTRKGFLCVMVCFEATTGGGAQGWLLEGPRDHIGYQGSSQVDCLWSKCPYPLYYHPRPGKKFLET